MLNAPCLILQLSLSNPLESGIKSRMKMQLEQRRQAMLQLHLSDQPLPTRVRFILEILRYLHKHILHRFG